MRAIPASLLIANRRQRGRFSWTKRRRFETYGVTGVGNLGKDAAGDTQRRQAAERFADRESDETRTRVLAGKKQQDESMISSSTLIRSIPCSSAFSGIAYIG